MKIYIEDVIIINFVVNLTLILIISNCLKLKTNKFKLIFACLIASASSLIYGLSYVDSFIKYILEILISLFILSFSFKNLNSKKLIQSFLLLFLVSNLYSGMLQTFNCYTKFGAIIGDLYSSVACLIVLAFISLTTSKLLRLICQKQKLHTNICKVEMKFNDKEISTFGYFDTGNNLTHNTNPVSIVNYKLFENLTDIKLSQYLSKNFDLQNAQYIKTSTLTGSKNLLMFTIDKMIITKNNKQEIIKNPKFALSLNLQNNKDYDIILNNSYI